MVFHSIKRLLAKADPRPKNRVGGFRRSVSIRVRRFPSQVIELHPATVPTSYSTASGIVQWLSPDPIGIDGGLNQFVFCANDPVNFRDPLGLDFWGDVGSGAGKVWNVPNTAVGVTVGIVGLGISQLPGLPGGSVRFRHNAIEFENNPLMFAGAITLGNTINYKGCESKKTFGPFAELDNGYVWQHEMQHTFQGELLGPLYLPANILGAAGGYLSEGDYHGIGNFMETGPSAWPPRMWP